MSVRFRLVHMLESRVSSRFATVCQKKRTRRGLPGEARAEDDVGVAVEDRLEQLRVLARIVLEVGVLDEGDVAGDVRHGRAHGGALALVALVVHHDEAEVVGVSGTSARNASSASRGAVARAVVDDDDLPSGSARPGPRSSSVRTVATSL